MSLTSVSSVPSNGPSPIVQKLDAFSRTQVGANGRDSDEPTDSAAEKAREARREGQAEEPARTEGRGRSLDILV